MNTKEKDNLQIEQEVFSETSLRKLLKYFPNYKSLLIFHARQMGEAFLPKPHMDGCDFCKRRAAQRNVQFEWKGDHYDTEKTTALLFLGLLTRHPSASKPDYEIRFATNHQLCRSCVSSMKWKRVFAELIDNLSILFVLLAAVLIMGGFSICGIALTWKSEERFLFWGLAWLAGGGLCLVGFFRYIFKIYSWVMPKEFRMIAKQPFKLIQIK